MVRKFKTEWLPLSELRTHPRVQREFDEAWAEKIAAAFDPDEFGTLSVLRVPERAYCWVFDGQHRRWAAEQVLGANQRVPCNVYEGLSDEQCAKITHGLQTRKAWRSLDSFLNRVRFDPVARSIHAIIETHGLTVSHRFDPGVVRAVVACEWIYTKCSSAILDRTLSILKQSWASFPEAFESSMVKGMGLFLEHHGESIDEPHFVRRLTAYGNPVRFLGHARELSKVAHKTLPRAVLMILVEEYNKKLRGNSRLEVA